MDDNIKIGQINNIIRGEKIAIFSTGSITSDAFDFIKTNKLNFSLYSFPFISNLSKEVLYSIASNYKKIITLEEHQLNCGFGSSILEVLNDFYEKNLNSRKIPIKRIGIKNKFYECAGTQEYFKKVAFRP